MRKFIGTFSSILLTASALTVPPAVASAAPAPQMAGDTHVYALTGTSVFQTTRHANGAWTSFAGGNANALPARGVGAVATISGDQFVLQSRGVANTSGVYLAIAHPDGTWTYPGYVRPASTGEIGAANVAGELQAVIPDGPTLMHGILHNGTWTAFNDVETQAGDIGTTVSAATAGADSQLQLAAATSTGDLFHTIRRADGSWAGFGDVKAETGDPGIVTRVAEAAVSNQAQLVVVTSTGRVMHTIRAANGQWERFGDVLRQIGTPGTVTDVAVASGVGGQLQVVLSTSAGGIVHAIRNANGAWTHYGNVKPEAGNPGSVSGVAASSEN